MAGPGAVGSGMSHHGSSTRRTSLSYARLTLYPPCGLRAPNLLDGQDFGLQGDVLEGPPTADSDVAVDGQLDLGSGPLEGPPTAGMEEAVDGRYFAPAAFGGPTTAELYEVVAVSSI